MFISSTSKIFSTLVGLILFVLLVVGAYSFVIRKITKTELSSFVLISEPVEKNKDVETDPFGKQPIENDVPHCPAEERLKFSVTLPSLEAFIDFLKNVEALTMVKIAAESSNIIVLRSLTKFFAIPGLRIGYLIGNKKIVENISKFQPAWSVNFIAQLVGKEVIKDTSYIKQTREYILKEKEIFFKKLKMMSGLKPYPPSANFILCKLTGNKFNSKTLSGFLSRKGILIRDCSNFRGLNNKFFRVAVRKRNENLLLINELNKTLNYEL